MSPKQKIEVQYIIVIIREMENLQSKDLKDVDPAFDVFLERTGCCRI